jgi:hypothetical protein
MSGQPDPYVRVYYRVIDDERFVGIYSDDQHLATWLRLLLLADAVWPASCPIPRSVRKASLQALVRAGLVDVLPGDHFRIHGLTPERQKRSDWGRNAAALRWQSDRNATAMRPHSDGNAAQHGKTDALLAEPSRAEPRKRAPAREDSENDPYDAPEMEALGWLAKHGASLSETSGVRRKLILLVEKFGTERVIATFDRLARAGILDGDARGFVFGAEEQLFPKADVKALDREDNAEEERRRFDRGVERTQRMLREVRGES